MQYVRFFIGICLSILIFTSCQKDNDGTKNDISIDARLIISDPSQIIIDINKDDFDRQVNQDNLVSNVRLLNDSGGSLEVRRSDRNKFESDLNLAEKNFSASDNFKIEVQLTNGDIIESEWMQYLQSEPSVSLRTSIGENFINYRFLFSNNKEESYYLKWDAVSTYSISNYLKTFSIVSDRDCDRWAGVNLCQTLAGGDAESLMASVDCDRDGLSNALECDLGNNPRNPMDKVDTYDPEIDASYKCYVTNTKTLENSMAEVLPQNDPNILLNQTAKLLQTAINHEFSEQYVLHVVVDEISSDHYKYLKGEIEQGNLRHKSDDSYIVDGFFEVSNRTEYSFITKSDQIDNSPIVCESKIFAVEEGSICEDCKEALKSEGDVRYVRPSYWPAE